MNHILFLVVDTMLASNIPLRFRKIFLTYIIKIMTINDQIRDEKLQYDINREASKISGNYQVKFINMNILLVKIYYHLINNK